MKFTMFWNHFCPYDFFSHPKLNDITKKSRKEDYYRDAWCRRCNEKSRGQVHTSLRRSHHSKYIRLNFSFLYNFKASRCCWRQCPCFYFCLLHQKLLPFKLLQEVWPTMIMVKKVIIFFSAEKSKNSAISKSRTD